MSYTFLNLEQGSDDWLKHRVDHWNSSESPIIMGCNKQMSRSEFMALKAKGEAKKYSDWVKNVLFARGHEIEKVTRQEVNRKEGLNLRPTVSVRTGTLMSASLDGFSECMTIIWECKQWNAAKAAWVMEHGTVPECDYWQVVHQFHCTPAETCLYTISDGYDKIFTIPISRDSIPTEQFERLYQAWVMFDEEKKKLFGQVLNTESLPDLKIKATVTVAYSNLPYYTKCIREMFSEVQTDLKTDKQFVEAKRNIKICEKAEQSIKSAEENFLLETGDVKRIVDEFRYTNEFVRTVRLQLNRQVKKREDEIKSDLCDKAKEEVTNYHKEQSSALPPPYSLPPYNFESRNCIKNKKTEKSIQDALSVAVANAKLDIFAIASNVTKNINAIEELENKDVILPDRDALAKTKTVDEMLIIYETRRIKAKEEEKKPDQTPTKAQNYNLADSKQTTETRTLPFQLFHTLVSKSLLLRCLLDRGVHRWNGYEYAREDHEQLIEHEVKKYDKYK